MHITGIVTCVNYMQYLENQLDMWRCTLDNLLVITDFRDGQTQDVCKQFEVKCMITDRFYLDGALFNKGSAINAGYELLDKETELDWVLFFDADIAPPSNWRMYCLRECTDFRNLYGCGRVDWEDKDIYDEDIAGFFHLFNVRSPNAKIKPIVDTHWYHAGNYDSTFQNRWSKERRICLPFKVKHNGEVGKNWCGISNQKALARLHRDRVNRNNKWDHETVEFLNKNYST